MRFFAIMVLFVIILLGSCQTDIPIDPQQVNSKKKLQEYLYRGWNSWNNSDILSYVFLPQGLSMKISFRESVVSDPPQYLGKVLIHNTAEDNIKVKPVAHSTDGRYMDFYLTWKNLEARIQVVRKRRDIIILYTPVKVPSVSPVINLEVGMLWGGKGRVQKNGDFIQAEISGTFFSIGSTSRIEYVPQPISTLYLSFSSKEEVGFFTGEVQSLNEIREYVNIRKKIHEEKQKFFGNFSEGYNVIQNVLSWNMTCDPMKQVIITPVSRNRSERAGGWVMYNSESFLNALMYSVSSIAPENWVDKFHAYTNVITMAESITDNGFLPDYTGALSPGHPSASSQAPLGSMVCYMIYQKYNEKWFLREVYDELLSWNRWWDRSRNNRGYLTWGSESTGKHSGTKENAISESDLRTTYYFKDVPYNQDSHKMEIASVELMSLYIADCNALAEIAGILNLEDDRAELLQRGGKYSEKLNELWDESTGIYRDKNLMSNQFVQLLPATNFYALLSGVPDQVKAERMVREHLLNPDEFTCEYMIPLMARNSQALGDTIAKGFIISPKVNFLIYLGLKNYDFPEVRKLLAASSMNLLMKEWGQNRRVYEYYNPLTGLGSDIPGNESFYTTGGLLALISIQEEKP